MKRLLTLTLLCGAIAAPAVSQTLGVSAGAITGTITDATKAVLPGVTVTLSGPSLMGTQVVVTDQNGSFRLPSVPIGEDYKVVFELGGFQTVIREGIHISLGFTATANVELTPASVTESVTVSGASPVVDVQSTTIANHFDATKMALLPAGSRDYWALVADMPGAQMSRPDVGGSGAMTQAPFTAYGLSGSGGSGRAVVEGIMSNEGSNGNMYYTDYGSMAEVSTSAVGNGAEVPTPGVLGSFIVKSGGNAYHGNLYGDYENKSMEAHNIDARQLGLGIVGGGAVAAVDTNRLTQYSDFNVDVGGFIRKDKLWWYGAYRDSRLHEGFPNIVDSVADFKVPDATGKVTYHVNSNDKLTVFYQHAGKNRPQYPGSFVIPGMTEITHAIDMYEEHFPTNVTSVGYTSVLSSSLFLELRAGEYDSNTIRTGKNANPRIEDVGNLLASGGNYGAQNKHNRPQANGAVNYYKNGWMGTHNFKVGFDVMNELNTQQYTGFSNACNCVSVFNNGVPSQVYLTQSPNDSKFGIWTEAVYVSDAWRPSKRLTLNLGLRFDRNRIYLPDQEGPEGTKFAAVDDAVTFNDWGPRLGLAYDVNGDGKTVVKGSYGQYNPSSEFALASSINPNPWMWYKSYVWTDTVVRNGIWDPGEEGRLVAVSGGTASTSLDPGLKNTYTRQASVFVEREAAPNIGVRTGFVWNGVRQPYGNVNANRPLSAFTVPVQIKDPGPDGKVGTADDGQAYTGYNLSADYASLTPVNITKTLTNSIGTTDNDFYTWELVASKRQTSWWSLQASFAKTWSRSAVLAGGGAAYTPNALTNTVDGRNRSSVWQGKINGTVRFAGDVRVSPILRYQSGANFARTFITALNFGNATILAEPFNAERNPNVTIFDVRSEKGFRLSTSAKIVGFFDVYNIFNTNAEQTVAVNSGSSFLRPTLITAPRIARVGIKLEW